MDDSVGTQGGKVSPEPSTIKGELQWKNDLGLYFSLVLVMKIGMCDSVIFRLV